MSQFSRCIPLLDDTFHYVHLHQQDSDWTAHVKSESCSSASTFGSTHNAEHNRSSLTFHSKNETIIIDPLHIVNTNNIEILYTFGEADNSSKMKSSTESEYCIAGRRKFSSKGTVRQFVRNLFSSNGVRHSFALQSFGCHSFAYRLSSQVRFCGPTGGW